MQNKNDEFEINEEELAVEIKGDDDASSDTGAVLASAEIDGVMISKSKLILIKKLLNNIKENNEQLTQLLSVYSGSEDETRIGIGQAADSSFVSHSHEAESGKIIEGVFDGEMMIGPDGKQYSVPANYASKSKLVEGDILKLTITHSGTFIYKQIGPIERNRIVGKLKRVGDNEFIVVADDDKSWRILNASVTYFKGAEGDETVILVPKNGESKWAAVENIIGTAV